MASSRKMHRNKAADFFDAHPSHGLYKPREVSPPQEPIPQIAPKPAHMVLNDAPVHNAHLNPTCVTPYIAELAKPYFTNLEVAGSKPPEGIDGLYEMRFLQSNTHKNLCQKLLDAHYGPVPDIQYRTEDAQTVIAPGKRQCATRRYRRVTVRQEVIEVGDVVIIARGSRNPGTTAAPLPRYIKDQPYAHVGELFWFVKVLSIRREDHTFHGQWFEHGSQTVLEELAHPQELYLTKLCDDVKITSILTRWICIRLTAGERPSREDMNRCQFFYSLMYDSRSGSFTDIPKADPSQTDIFHCSLCSSAENERNRTNFVQVVDEPRQLEGFANHDEVFHYGDSVMISSERGPCIIGQILGLPNGRWTGDFWVTVRLFGRISDRKDYGRATGVGIYEDRHLFLSNEYWDVKSSEIIRKCYVLLKPPEQTLKTWVKTSPLHFYFSFVSNSLDNDNGQSPLMPHPPTPEFILCGYCMEREQTRAGEFEEFTRSLSASPLRLFDPFAGVGAFALGMCKQGAMRFTHAIEIDTCAARTILKNSPGTAVYNQCSNTLLLSAVKTDVNKPESLDPKMGKLPPLPRPGQIDCIVSGFPCQPHSSMNMYMKARDLQNELFLNTISWVDYMKPRYCVFENVKGFVRYQLLARQDGRHRVTGGIPLGGLKFICRALVSMGYQIRFGLLQAALYGTPQTRVRFFLLAARSGYRLPNLPEPTHEFSANQSDQIPFPVAGSISTINAQGTAPFPCVTIKDAISDLKRWDWENPCKVYSRQESGMERPDRQGVPKIKCSSELPWCGVSENPYEHAAFSAFQAQCREQPANEIQHITPCFDDATVERAVNINLAANANYLDLHTNSKAKLFQYQMTDPTSANARAGFKSGMYGRLGEDDLFKTIVTNVHPTAKQSRIMNPWCRRILSVRELARAQGFPDCFEFITSEDKPDINSMHRGIGNAVPWPVAAALSREIILSKFGEERGDFLKNKLDEHDQDWVKVHRYPAAIPL